MQKTKTLSTVALIIMLPTMLYYPYHTLAWNFEMSFLDMGLWTRDDSWVDPDAVIAMPTRIVFFVVWALPTVFGFLGYLMGFRLLLLFRSGHVFDRRIADGLYRMGICVAMSSGLALFAGAVSPMIRSWHNADGPLPLRIWYSSGNFGLLFCGLGFVYLGLVMREAIKLARENEGFV